VFQHGKQFVSAAFPERDPFGTDFTWI